MERLEVAFAALAIARRAEPMAEPTYLLELACAERAAGSADQLVAVSCSDCSIRLHHGHTLRLLGRCSGHGGPVCGVRFAPASGSLLFSGSADGTARCWDARSPGSAAVQVFRGCSAHAFCSFDVSPSGAVLCAGTERLEEDSFLVFWDARMAGSGAGGGAPLGVYSESHSDDVTQVRFHPRDPDRLASGSTDGLVNVFDIRRGSEEEALLGTCNSESSVSRVCWAGRGYGQLLCLSHDEGVYLWDTARLDTEEPLTLLSSPRAREAAPIDGGGPLDYFIGGAWLEAEEKLLVLGGTHRGDLYLLDCGPGGLKQVCALRGGHSATVRCFHWDPEGGALLTGGEDAQLLLWKPGAVELSSDKRSSLKSAPALRHKARARDIGSGKREKK
uniref:WD repeat-containing protein 89 n=1 Tax=Lepisosteus oculatus TaxID=7918 RepID=W5NME9_LEPOC|nr:PREDICTED: WD repeat-containing protein 89 [Lepisosteus oculatus]XP_015205543.1 PREDICTED: WD repeat-containing protein 89 [Lepisosteus oculatus]XP_015205544.1 PREDICTED: WD repeat-containing protein 89 [Lepisosteus oculatus]XP_015205545.1 PREDICTED: WD repeat-containing protein 89 [Lepisosteus oculatus]